MVCVFGEHKLFQLYHNHLEVIRCKPTGHGDLGVEKAPRIEIVAQILEERAHSPGRNEHIDDFKIRGHLLVTVNIIGTHENHRALGQELGHTVGAMNSTPTIHHE
ncbi:hypothetical protein ES708_32903 [subsurface metagenome]